MNDSSITVRDCEQSAPEDEPENAAFIQIFETPPGEDTKRLFSGWMFSSSPALSELEHAVYDVTLLGCKAPSAAAPAPAPPTETPPGHRSQTAAAWTNGVASLVCLAAQQARLPASESSHAHPILQL